MCARITMTTTPAEIADLFGLLYDQQASAHGQQPHGRPPLSAPRYNVTPSQPVPVVRARPDGAREVVAMSWGLVPHWNTNPRPKALTNARAETVATKTSIRDPLRHRRCLVPAGGFYDYQNLGKARQPYYFTSAGGGQLVFAALWDRWEGPGGAYEGVAVVTVEPDMLVRALQKGMPAVVPAEEGQPGAYPPRGGVCAFAGMLPLSSGTAAARWR